jgi:hypothetical protein
MDLVPGEVRAGIQQEYASHMPTGVYIDLERAFGRFEELKIELRKKPGESSTNETKFQNLSQVCTPASQERASTVHFRHFWRVSCYLCRIISVVYSLPGATTEPEQEWPIVK